MQAMVSELQGEQAIALDLEAHSFRSFQGFTCLLQLSSRSADYLVDTLALRGHLGPAMARLLADPNVVKVRAGACICMCVHPCLTHAHWAGLDGASTLVSSTTQLADVSCGL